MMPPNKAIRPFVQAETLRLKIKKIVHLILFITLTASFLAGSSKPVVASTTSLIRSLPIYQRFPQANFTNISNQIVPNDDGGVIYLPMVSRPASTENWSTVAGNPQRTSWISHEVTGNLTLQWYRPIEAYIPQNVQIIAVDGLLYISTAKGLVVLNANDGSLAWRFDTELPLGNSPTVDKGVVYVGGYDRKLYALDARSGQQLWAFSGAGAGYSANPLVVDNMVIVGNRDGRMYAIGAHNTPRQGQLIWSFTTGGPIFLTAAYSNGRVYFAAGDNRAYALNAANGALVWRSNILPGEQYQSYWPVIYQDKVIFSVAQGYRTSSRPGLNSVTNQSGSTFGTYRELQLEGIFEGYPEGEIVGDIYGPQPGSNDFPQVDSSSVLEYLEDNPAADAFKHKPWRRVFVILNQSNGEEYRFDTDGDGYMEYAPFAWWGTNSGNRYPPIVGPNGMLYAGTLYQCCSDSKGRVMGWYPGDPFMSVIGGMGALAEPQAISGGGNTIYRNLCCDRVGDYFSATAPGQSRQLWSYNLEQQAPGYDPTWVIWPGWPRLQGWYRGATNSINAAYHNHGDQNPIVPHQGRLFVHRSNTIIAYGTGSGPGSLPMIRINPAPPANASLDNAQLTARLEQEINKMIDAGLLRPGYYNPGQFAANNSEFVDYFANPGETLYVLSIAYPHLSPALQSRLRPYLQLHFTTYFDPNMYATIGWNSGAPREEMILPPEVQADLVNHPPRPRARGFSWEYPPFNFYAMWKYAQIFPNDAGRIYDLARSKINTSFSSSQTSDYFRQRPFEHNAYLAGYLGFLRLQEMAGRTTQDAQLRTQVTNEYNRLLALRAQLFSKDSYWVNDRYHKKHLDVSANFLWLVPEVADYLRQNRLSDVQAAVQEYEAVAPYWFVARLESSLGEGVMANLYSINALFQARALILRQSKAQLTHYIDVPAFIRGDLFYIQNLVTAIQAGN